VGGVVGVPAERIVVRDNYLYNPPANVANKNQGMLLGYADTSNKDVKLIDNYVVSRVPLRLWWWESVECTGNTIYTQGTSVDLRLPAGAAPAAYRWNGNIYISGRTGGPVFGLGAGSPLDFLEWKRRTGLDADSRAVEDASRRPAGVSVFVRPNKYEPGRAHVIVYNWAGEESVPVDVSSVLQPGAAYELRDAQDYYGEPLLRGTYDGKPLRVPKRSTRLAAPAGDVERAPSHTSPEFQVFVLRRLPAAM
jgi:hypothetical protein